MGTISKDIINNIKLNEYERYLSIQLAPPSLRADLLAICAFSMEILSIRNKIKDPSMGLLRIYWWKDILKKIENRDPPQNPIALLLDGRLNSELSNKLKLILDVSEKYFLNPENNFLLNDIESSVQSAWLSVLGVNDQISEESTLSIGKAWGILKNQSLESEILEAEELVKNVKKIFHTIPKKTFPAIFLGSIILDQITNIKNDKKPSGNLKKQWILLKASIIKRI